MIAATATDYQKIVDKYVAETLDGTRVTGVLEQAMCQRYLDDMDRVRVSRRAHIPADRLPALDEYLGHQAGKFIHDESCPFFFSRKTAMAACNFFPMLKHSDGEYAGLPFELYPWQVFIVWNLFGWRMRETGYRRFRTAFISVGRGNGKTPFGAALMLLILAFDVPHEERAEVYTAAVKRDQAALSFDAARRFVERSGFTKRGFAKSLKTAIDIPRFSSKMLPLSSDAKSADGLNVHGLLLDELHAWTEHQREYREKLRTALGKRRQPLEVVITTAGTEASSLWKEEYAVCRKVVERNNDYEIDSKFVAIYEIDDEDDELDPAVWPKANPMLEFGVVKESHLRDLAKMAEVDPSKKSELRRYHANKLTMSFNKTFHPSVWDRGNEPIPWGELKDGHCAVDMGWRDDLAALGYVFPLDWVEIEGKSKRRWAVFCDAFCPTGTKRPLNREPFSTWVRAGRLIVTESDWTDTAPMYKAIEKRHEDYTLHTVAFDPNNCREFATNVQNEIGIECYPFQQSHQKYNEPLREFKIAVSEGRIIHGGDALLRWAALNCVEEEDSKGHRMPAKNRSADKIDPFVAVIMAFSEALFAERQKKSVYEERGPVVY